MEHLSRREHEEERMQQNYYAIYTLSNLLMTNINNLPTDGKII
jgi:hypothetical protein